jgi:hypothetical protein
MLQPRDVAVATIRLMLSDLTGQVLDVRRHDGLGAVVGPDLEASVPTRERSRPQPER